MSGNEKCENVHRSVFAHCMRLDCKIEKIMALYVPFVLEFVLVLYEKTDNVSLEIWRMKWTFLDLQLDKE